MDKFIGKKIDGRYHIIELVGIGGMANVYKARDILENRPVAVKIQREEYVGNEEFTRRFRNESKAIALLSHPNIIKVYDVSLSDKVPAIIMEYADGITLKEYIEQEGALRWKEAVHFAVQILRGLQHAHDNGIVHRDVKPQNIMLLPDGTIKITDFGIARFSRAQSRTITDRAIGSVHYISPEQARGEITDQKADLYSVGVMIYEMLTGKLPFDADSPVSVAIKQIESEAVSLRSHNPDIPEGLEEITLRAMQKDTGARYQSAAEMLRDIDRFKKDPSISFEYRYMTDNKTPPAAPPPPKKTSRGIEMAKTNTKKPNKNSDKVPILPVLTGITLAFVLATIVFVTVMIYMNNPFIRVEEVALPNFVGMSYDQVKDNKEFATNFNIQLESTEPNGEYEEGYIFYQSPSTVKRVKTGSTIKVKVSSGSQMVPLPDFAGQEATGVFAELGRLGFEYEEASVYSETVKEGYVTRTDPAKNTELATGSTVTVYVSRGSNLKMVTVPDVENIDVEDAKTILTNSNLKANVLYQQSDSYPAGQVIRQDPEKASMVPENSMVSIYVSSGESTIKRLALLVALPTSITQSVTLRATQDGNVTREESVIPSETRVWRPAFQGTTGSSEVVIYLNGEVYQRYTMDFDLEGHQKTEDNSASFEFEE